MTHIQMLVEVIFAMLALRLAQTAQTKEKRYLWLFAAALSMISLVVNAQSKRM